MADIVINTRVEGAEETVRTFSEIQTEIRNLRLQMSTASGDELTELTTRFNLLNAQVDRSRNLMTKSGSAFTNFNDTLGRVGRNLLSLDFGAAADSAALLNAQAKQLTFKEMTSGLKEAGSALVNVGKAILRNPLLLLVSIVVGVTTAIITLKDDVKILGDAFDFFAGILDSVIQLLKDMTDAFGLTSFAAQDSARKVIETSRNKVTALNDERDVVLNNIDAQIIRYRALGLQTNLLEIERIEAIRRTTLDIITQNNIQINELRRLQTLKGRLKDEEKEQLNELLQSNEKFNQEVIKLDDELFAKQLEGIKARNEEIKKLDEETFKRRKELYDIQFDIETTFYSNIGTPFTNYINNYRRNLKELREYKKDELKLLRDRVSDRVDTVSKEIDANEKEIEDKKNNAEQSLQIERKKVQDYLSKVEEQFDIRVKELSNIKNKKNKELELGRKLYNENAILNAKEIVASNLRYNKLIKQEQEIVEENRTLSQTINELIDEVTVNMEKKVVAYEEYIEGYDDILNKEKALREELTEAKREEEEINKLIAAKRREFEAKELANRKEYLINQLKLEKQLENDRKQFEINSLKGREDVLEEIVKTRNTYMSTMSTNDKIKYDEQLSKLEWYFTKEKQLLTEQRKLKIVNEKEIYDIERDFMVKNYKETIRLKKQKGEDVIETQKAMERDLEILEGRHYLNLENIVLDFNSKLEKLNKERNTTVKNENKTFREEQVAAWKKMNADMDEAEDDSDIMNDVIAKAQEPFKNFVDGITNESDNMTAVIIQNSKRVVDAMAQSFGRLAQLRQQDINNMYAQAALKGEITELDISNIQRAEEQQRKTAIQSLLLQNALSIGATTVAAASAAANTTAPPPAQALAFAGTMASILPTVVGTFAEIKAITNAPSIVPNTPTTLGSNSGVNMAGNMNTPVLSGGLSGISGDLSAGQSGIQGVIITDSQLSESEARRRFLLNRNL